jgi:hypothetical protein
MKLQRRHVLVPSLIALAVVLVGLAAFALSGGLDDTVTERVHGGGPRVVRVALVDAVVGFDVTPDRLVVDPGTHLVLNVVNKERKSTTSRSSTAAARTRSIPVSRNGSTSA